MDAFGIVKPAVRALAAHGRSVYDSYIDCSPRHKTRKKRADRRDDTWRITNGHAILDTVLRSASFPGYDYGRVAAFLAGNLSAGGDVPACSRRAPHFLQHLVADWERCSEIHDDFDLDICRNMEYAMRYGRDLVYTESGYFGLTSEGEAEEGLWLVVMGGSDDLVLLREKATETDTWYEYVDRVFLNHYDAKIEKLEDLRGNTTIQRLEIRS
ncbi:hypothetical protein GGR54DRAFT_243158 [Hypoxylon sp. NC1633]|nr:hypothetical protein GGR54DRAFT_243158 [Hypoxylon sp. NC1633]